MRRQSRLSTCNRSVSHNPIATLQENGTNTLTITETPTPAAPGDSRPASRKKTLQKVGAGAAGLALVGGALCVAANTGETRSAWEASQPGTHETITDGKLGLSLSTNRGWYDVTDSTKAGTAVDPASFSIIPGDKLEKAQEISVELTGTNIAAELTADIKNIGGDLATEGLSGTIRLVKGSYDPASGAQPAEVITTTPIVNNPVAPQFTFNSAVTSADGVYTVLTDLTFSQASVLGQSASGVLEDTGFNLKQVRPQAPKPWVIPDPYLAYVISQQLDIPQDKLTTADALKLTYLDVGPNGGYYPYLASLEGLQYATNLTGINISWTKVSDLSPLSGATKLTTFTANHADNLTSIAPLAGLKLVYVTAEWTQIDSINALSAMDTLRSVDLLGDLALPDVNALAGKPNLDSVSVAYAHSLTSLEALRFDAALTAVDARQSGVTDWSPVDHVASVFK